MRFILILIATMIANLIALMMILSPKGEGAVYIVVLLYMYLPIFLAASIAYVGVQWLVYTPHKTDPLAFSIGSILVTLPLALVEALGMQLCISWAISSIVSSSLIINLKPEQATYNNTPPKPKSISRIATWGRFIPRPRWAMIGGLIPLYAMRINTTGENPDGGLLAAILILLCYVLLTLTILVLSLLRPQFKRQLIQSIGFSAASAGYMLLLKVVFSARDALWHAQYSDQSSGPMIPPAVEILILPVFAYILFKADKIAQSQLAAMRSHSGNQPA